ncbi:hypothetical protein [Ferirhizobium litorale]|uniref:Yip1 domain-containing protein n=1 Tax=Ferirhizobium litorale TaxID=2927786 RepID=A0AAE3U1L0_9HYPH|nr:hypothetical protein [Fererhizobium litorale]MDI7922541.1 hypothetical protein [Fererhizobium litorale]
MPSLKEVQYYLTGLWLLAKLSPHGLRYLDLTDRGMLRSFWAMAWCLPPTAISWIWWQSIYLSKMPDGTSTGLPFFLRLALVEIINWLVPLLLVGLVALVTGFGQRFSAIVTAVNWLIVPFTYASGLVVGTVFLFPAAEPLLGPFWLILMAGLIIALTRILRMICGANPLRNAALIIALLAPAIPLSEALQRFLGVYPL